MRGKRNINRKSVGSSTHSMFVCAGAVCECARSTASIQSFSHFILVYERKQTSAYISRGYSTCLNTLIYFPSNTKWHSTISALPHVFVHINSILFYFIFILARFCHACLLILLNQSIEIRVRVFFSFSFMPRKRQQMHTMSIEAILWCKTRKSGSFCWAVIVWACACNYAHSIVTCSNVNADIKESLMVLCPFLLFFRRFAWRLKFARFRLRLSLHTNVCCGVSSIQPYFLWTLDQPLSNNATK